MVNRVVATKLTEEEHTRFLDVCNQEGCTPSALIKKAILREIEEPTKEEEKKEEKDLTKLDYSELSRLLDLEIEKERSKI